MKLLFLSELERLWQRKLTWLFFIAIPFILLATAKYYLSANLHIPLDSPEYVTASSFPVMALIEQLILVFNIMSIVLLTLSFTEEYRTGQLRMVMLRAFTFGQLFRAKVLAFIVTMGLFFLSYLVVSIGVGQVFFDSSSVTHLFHHDTLASTADIIIYTLNYYGLALLTILGTGSIIIAITVLCQTSTAAIGLGMGFLLSSLGYPIVFTIFNNARKLNLSEDLQFLSLTEIQYKGIALMLSDTAAFSSQHYLLAALLIIGSYIMVCGSVAYLAFTKTDRWI